MHLELEAMTELKKGKISRTTKFVLGREIVALIKEYEHHEVVEIPLDTRRSYGQSRSFHTWLVIPERLQTETNMNTSCRNFDEACDHLRARLGPEAFASLQRAPVEIVDETTSVSV